MPLDKIDFIVLEHPGAPGNKKHLPEVRKKAQAELLVMEECLMWGCDDEADAAIKADIDRIKSAPGMVCAEAPTEVGNELEGGE